MASLHSNPLDTHTAARAWSHGWALSRSTQAPVEQPGYLQIHVGKPDHLVRCVLPRLDDEVLRGLVAGARPGLWLKVCAPVERVRPLLTTGWTVHEPEFLMSTDLAASAVPVAPGYRIQTENVGALAIAKVLTDTGELAASGQAALHGGFATFDQIVTDPAHRRKGLGRSVMAALSGTALERGATHGVLVATEAGAALYQALGWALVSPVTAASVPLPAG